MEILEVVSDGADEQVTISLKGELDLSTVGKVEEELRRVEAIEASVVVLDLSGLTFLDSTGLRAVITADERAREQGRRFVVVKGPRCGPAGVLDHAPRGAPGDGRRRFKRGLGAAPWARQSLRHERRGAERPSGGGVAGRSR